MISGYAPIIRAHAAALRAFMDKTTEASEVHLPMLPWMTPEIIGLERYELLPLRYKKQRSQTRHGGRFNSSAHQTEEVFVTELEELRRNGDRKECNIEPYRPSMVDEEHAKNSLKWCEINIAISLERMKESVPTQYMKPKLSETQLKELQWHTRCKQLSISKRSSKLHQMVTVACRSLTQIQLSLGHFVEVWTTTQTWTQQPKLNMRIHG